MKSSFYKEFDAIQWNLLQIVYFISSLKIFDNFKLFWNPSKHHLHWIFHEEIIFQLFKKKHDNLLKNPFNGAEFNSMSK